MNLTTTKTILLLSMMCVNVGQAQWTTVSNNQINWEIQVTQDYYGGGADGIDPIADPTIRTDLFIIDQWLGELCYTFEAAPPIYNYDNTNWYAGSYYGFAAEFTTWIGAWESDNDDECTYTDGDDDYWAGFGLLREGLTSMRFTYPSSDFYPCNWNPYLGDGGSTWLYDGYDVIYDQGMQLTWRYAYGSSLNDCLNFGNISGENDYDVNSNRFVSGESGVSLAYTNSGGTNSSADVWYSFTIPSKSVVTISTDHAETNFDTYLQLYNNSGTVITQDDDGGSNNTSTINITLCAGTYKFCVEGYDTSTGVFKVSATASPAQDITVTVNEVSTVECPNDNNGYASWTVTEFPSNGYDVYLDNSYFGQSSSVGNLSVGNHNLTVIDACSTQSSATINITASDATPPTAHCADDYNLVVYPLNPESITYEDINAGSTDNCGIASMAISQSEFSTSDVGVNPVELTVIDVLGNVSTCVTHVTVEVGVGIEEETSLSNFEIMPNPNNGRFRLTTGSNAAFPTAYYSIFDLTGRVIMKAQLKSTSEEIVLDHVLPGTYFMRVEQGASSTTRKVVIE